MFFFCFDSGFIHNVYTEEEEESVVVSSGQLALENSITMNKMKLLKAKMENMNLSKKVPKEFSSGTLSCYVMSYCLQICRAQSC